MVKGHAWFYSPRATSFKRPPEQAAYRLKVERAKAPGNGSVGTVYFRSGRNHDSLSSKELPDAVWKLGKTTHPEILDPRVERMFTEKGWKIIWTPPYCQEF